MLVGREQVATNHARTIIRLALGGCLLLAAVAAAQPLSVERLTWAGIKLRLADTTVFVDAVGTDLWDGQAPEGLVPLRAETGRRYALVTHLHNDHFDVAGLKEVLGERGYVICHESMASHIASRGLKVIPARYNEPVSRGGFLMTPVPAQDGFGDEQVSWVIAVDGRRFIHAGDTLWHGKWELFGAQFGPFDAAFLPVNGALVGDDLEYGIPRVMTPREAVAAALALRARTLVPIHYGMDDPPGYVESPQALQHALRLARERGLTATHLRPGSSLSLDR